MGKKDILWQDTADVLALFGKTVTDARKSYLPGRCFVVDL
jgi:hypothetical protein